MPSLPRITTNSVPFLPASRGVEATETQDWKSQRAEQLSVSQGSAISPSVASPSPAGACITRLPRAGCSEHATVRNLDLSDAQTGVPWTVDSRPVGIITSA